MRQILRLMSKNLLFRIMDFTKLSLPLLIIFSFSPYLNLIAQNTPCTAINLPNNMTNFASHSTAGLSNSGVPNPDCGGNISVDIWFSVTVPISGDVDIATLPGTMTDAAMAIYEGPCSFPQLHTCTEDDNCGNTIMPILQFDDLTPGNTYYIRIWPETGGGGTFEIRITDGDPPITPPNLNPIGTAVSNGNCIQLTTTSPGQAGCAWSPNLIDFSQPISNTFTLNFGTIDGNGADGICMVYHNAPTGPNTCGQTGGSIAAEFTPNSFIIEFDTWNNGAPKGDIAQDHVSIDVNGDFANPINGPFPLPNIEDGQDHLVTFNWNPATQFYEVFFDGLLTVSGNYDIITNCFGGVNMVYCGFTASTGGSTNNQSVCSAIPDLYPAGVEEEVFVEICDGQSYFAGGGFQTTSGVYIDFFNSFNGCDSIITTNLTVNPSTNEFLNELVCEGDCFQIGGQTFCNPGFYQLSYTNQFGCDSLISLNLIVLELNPSIFVVGNLDCNNTILVLDAVGSTPAGANFQWTTIDGNFVGSTTNAAVVVDEPGTYEVEMIYSDGSIACTESTSYLVTQDISQPFINIIPPDDLDCGSSSVFIDGSNSDNGFNIIYIWEGPGIVAGNGTPIIEVDQPGDYTLTLLNTNNGCTIEETVTVDLDLSSILIDILPPEEITCNSTTIFIDATNSDGSPNLTYSWTTIDGTILNGSNSLLPEVGSAGTYTLTITNSNNGCFNAQDVIVNEDLTPPQVFISIPETINCIQNEVSIFASSTNPPNTISIVWNTINGNITSGVNSLNPTVNLAGNYAITLTNLANGCTVTESIEVEEDFIPPVTIAGPDLILDCNSLQIDLDGSLSDDGNNFMNQWFDSDGMVIAINDLTPTVNESGVYTLEITNTLNGCTATDEVIVMEDFATPTIIIQTVEVLDCQIGSVTIDASSSGSNNLDYSWSTINGTIQSGANSSMLTVSEAGDYTLVLTNTQNGCSVTEDVEVLSNVELPDLIIDAPDILTCTDTIIGLSGNTTLNPDDYEVTWSSVDGNIIDGINTMNPNVDATGTYVLNLLDITNGCEQMESVIVDENINVPISNAGADLTIECSNPIINLDGGQSSLGDDFQYSWIDENGTVIAEDTLSPAVGAAGNYTLLVTNILNGCVQEDEVLVTQDADLPTIVIQAPEILTCDTTTINIDATNSDNGTDFSFLWTTNDGSILSGINSLLPEVGSIGTYTLTITNNVNACVAAQNIIVNENVALPNVQIADPDLLTCDNTTLQLDASNSGNPADFDISWNTLNGNIIAGTQSLNPEISAIGDYTLTLTNLANGCQDSLSIEVIENTVAPNADAGLDGEIGCVTVLIPLSGFSTNSNVAYSWSTDNGNIISGNDANDPFVNAAGEYILSVTDLDNGCTQNDTVSIIPNTILPNVVIASPDILNCQLTDFDLDATSSDNGMGYSTLWMTSNGGNINSGGTGLTPNINEPGTYSLTITNNQTLCENSAEIEVLQDVIPIDLNIDAPEILTCSLTEMNLNLISSPPANYEYSWATLEGNILANDTTANPQINLNGDYFVTVTNTDNGCTETAEVLVNQDIANPNANAGVPMELNCIMVTAQLDGSLSSQGGSFDYQWSTSNGSVLNGVNTLNPTIESAGNYLLTVTNLDNDCQDTSSVVVNQNLDLPLPTIQAAELITCVEPTIILLGEFDLDLSDFQINWTTSDGNIVNGANTLNPEVNAEGDYLLTLTTNTGNCTTSENVLVDANQIIPDIAIDNPDTLNCIVQNFPLIGMVTNSLNFEVLWETLDGNFLAGENSLTPLIDEPGTYQMILTDSDNGCAETAFITVPEDILVPTISIDNPDILNCFETTISLDGNSSSSGANFNYLWTTIDGNIVNGANTLNPSINQPGTYILTIINETNGCSEMGSALVDQDITPPQVDAGQGGLLTCIIEELQLDGSNSSAGNPFTFSWNTFGGNIVSGENSPEPTVDQAGTYTLTILNNDNGCSETDQVEVTENITPPIANAGVDIEINCNDNQSILDGSGSTGISTISYAWSSFDGNLLSGENSVNPVAGSIGTYLLEVTNSINGCVDEDEILVFENLPIADIESSQPPCDEDRGSISILNVNGGTAPFLYSFDGGNSFGSSPNSGSLDAGSYNIIVQDIDGCEYKEAVPINQGLFAQATLPEEIHIELGDSAQFLTQINFPEQELASIQWTPSNNLSCTDCLQPYASPYETGLYQLEITTIDGCQATAQILLIVDRQRHIYVPNAFSPNGDGKNDVFLIFSDTKSVKNIKQFLVFNRWGETVHQYFNFQPNLTEFGWDGMHRGQPLDPGVMAWFAEIEFIDGEIEIFKGDVILMK